jgi:uncharacterized protein
MTLGPQPVCIVSRSCRPPIISCSFFQAYVQYMYIDPAGSFRFEWDPAKAARNWRKHGVQFDEARTVFSDEHGLLLDDLGPASDDPRFVLIGLSAMLRLLVVVHSYRDADRTIRIISARTATRSERAQYGAQFRR